MTQSVVNKKTSKGFERLLTRLALESINIPVQEIDGHLDKLLMLIGKYAKADHCYIQILSDDRSELVFRHSWCRRGYVPTLYSVRTADVPICWNAKRSKVIFVPDVFSLGFTPGTDLKERINPVLKSAFVAPLISNDVLWGFLGCSLSKRMQALPDELKSVVIIAAELVVNLYEKKRIYSQIEITESIVSRTKSKLAYFDRNGILLFSNTSFRENFILSGPEPGSMDFYSITAGITDSGESKLIKDFQAALSGKETQIEVWIRIREDLCLYEITLHPNANRDGEITGVIFNARDITDRVQLEAGILRAINEERKRIGILLHDDLGHDLLAAEIRLKLLSDRMGDIAPDITGELVDIEKSVKHIMNDVRRLSHGLIPFKNQGLELREMLDAAIILMNKYYGQHCTYSIHPGVDLASENVINELYNIIIESAVNAVKHSGCENITIDLSPEKNLYVLRVTDNGTGISKSGLDFAGAGLEIMKYRARSIGGLLEITGSPETGTTVKVSFNPGRINL